MKILALELSSERRSVALLDSCTQITSVAREQGGRHTHVFSLIEQVLQESGTPRESIEWIAVGVGPGSYTGIRMAISLAQGWHLALGTKLSAISSLDCLAEAARSQNMTGNISFIVDAQRTEYYLADYSLNGNGWQITTPLAIVARSVIENRINEGSRIAGPDAPRHFNSAVDLYPDASHLAMLACKVNKPTPPENMEPVYLRPISFVKAPPSRVINPENHL